MEKLARKFAFQVALTERPFFNFFQAKGQAHSLYIGSKVDQDSSFTDWLASAIDPREIAESVRHSEYLTWFENNITKWLLSHRYNNITGLEHFCCDYSQGSTQAFDSFYFRHRNRRFRCFVGEYFYHIKTWQSEKVNWCWLHKIEDLAAGDALVLSVPFCDTVQQLDYYKILMERCIELNIPVLLDMCYYIISHDLNVDLNYDCIDTVAFSLSKAWPVSTARIGIRFTKPEIFDGQKLHHSINYNNNISALIGCKIIQNYLPDSTYIDKKYMYNKICEVLNLKPTQSVCFAIGDKSWNQYSRKELLKSYQLDFDSSMFVNRICLNKLYQHYSMFQAFIKNETGIEI